MTLFARPALMECGTCAGHPLVGESCLSPGDALHARSRKPENRYTYPRAIWRRYGSTIKPLADSRRTEIMNRAELNKLWNRSKTDPNFHRRLLAMLAALAAVPATQRDQLAACALADFTLRKAGAAGRRDLKGRLKASGWEL